MTQDNVTLYPGDCLETLAGLPDASVDAVITDPPYGLSQEPDMAEVLTHWLAGDHYAHSGAGFMGKRWDSFVPGPEYWRAVYRVLKPGAHLLAFSSTRTWDLLSIAIRLAGFESRDTIGLGVPALAWTHGQGFPKSLDVSKAIDKAAGAFHSRNSGKYRSNAGLSQTMGGRVQQGAGVGSWQQDARGQLEPDPHTPATPAAAAWAGWGTALKPAWEVVLVFRKPLAAPTVAANVLRYGVGALNIDAARVGTEDALQRRVNAGTGNLEQWRTGARDCVTGSTAGRWPPNLCLVHHPACRPAGTRQVHVNGSGPVKGGNGYAAAGYEHGIADTRAPFAGYAAPDGTETVAAWTCDPACPVAALDRQAGPRTSGAVTRHAPGKHGVYGDYEGSACTPFAASEGMVSRFYPTFAYTAADFVPWRYVPKASRSERNRGCDGLPERAVDRYGEQGQGPLPQQTPRVTRQEGNHHPTVKPQALLFWLATLVTPPGGVILDPFMGSGSMGRAAVQGGWGYIGMELDPEYFTIAQARIAHAQAEAATARQLELAV